MRAEMVDYIMVLYAWIGRFVDRMTARLHEVRALNLSGFRKKMAILLAKV